ncbi:TonB-dependent receptor [Kordiimonas pumila]|uniref:TonB-dependent receptor n=1 Tax=Kordiimonas pumila TaxID=2161677 RepID=A0ABV7D2X9_9PROT|nr:TonB-dependent receptor [Kordiimonas pumila]
MFSTFFHIKRTHAKTILATSTILLSGVYVPAHAIEAPPKSKQVEEIVVSGAFEGRKVGETILGATVMRQEEIERQLDGSIGETLRRQPGISSTFFGPGASRPIIRGLGGDRIRILDNGLGSIDASSTSPDHAVAVEPAMAERIEILRGTAMLMYGSSAAGGVVNVIDGRIPTSVPENGVEGAIRYGHTTVNNGDEVSGAVNALLNEKGKAQFVIHADGMYRTTDDYDIPGYAESAQFRAAEEAEEADEGGAHEEEEEAYGTVPNTATKTKGGSVGLSAIFDNGFIGFNVHKLDSNYGVPGHSHEEGEEDHAEEDHEHEEESVAIDLKQTRYDLNGEYEADMGLFKKAKLRFGYADYKHTELEGDEIGTVFLNKGYEGRLDMIEKDRGNWGGATGVHVKYRDFEAIGDEAFVPATISRQYGLYSVKEYSTGPWQLDVGGRLEHTKHTADSINTSREFTNFSASAGAGYDLSEAAFIGITVSRTERAPSTEELFSNGAHLATKSYELGDATLGKETALGVEATFSYVAGPISFVVNGYVTSYDDFIYEANLGTQIDGLDVFEFTASDATLYGFETKTEYHAGTVSTETLGDIDIHLDGQLDMIRAKLKGTDENLPRIPPMSALFGVEARTTSVDVRTELEYAAKQTRVSDYELPTDDYLLLNAYVTVRPFESRNLSLELRGSNLTNAEARQHTSFLKELAPLPGRNIKVSMRMEF